jgi:tRNA (uracil-5-)-methyltransferase TRM9
MSVKDVYNTIAVEFDKTRTRIWPRVHAFLDTMPAGSHMLDNGCGNGKNMSAHPQIQWTGVDISEEQVRITNSRGYSAVVGSMTNLPFPTSSFDGAICIAAYHHLDSDADRAAALKELHRCLKPQGRALIMVWAMEQPADSKFTFTSSDTYVPWKSASGTVQRYYHIYREHELAQEVQTLCMELDVCDTGYERGNWWVELKKRETIV